MMGSTCCKSPYSPKIPDFGKFFINCPIKLCSEMTIVEEPKAPVRPSRKFSSSDISGPLPLGTVILPPKRPPRRKRRKISRTRSLNDLQQNMCSSENIIRSKSAVELNINDYETPNNNVNVMEDEPAVRLSPLVVRVDDNPQKFRDDDDTTPKIIISPEITPSPPSLEELENQPRINKLISINKRTFLAGLLEENNNVHSVEFKDNISVSRRSSITESLREFESSLYEMLSENAEDSRSEQSLNLPQVVAR